MGKGILKFLLGGLIAGAFCLAQEAPQEGQQPEKQPEKQDAFRISRRQNGLVIGVGEREIRNIYLNTKAKLGAAGFYRSFMHGVVDGDAMPVAWESLGENLPLDEEGFKTNVKSSELSSIVLNAGEKLTLPKPVISGDSLLQLKGKYVRFFIWITGEDTGQGMDLWSGAPTVKVEIVDFDGELLSSTPAYFRTRGTFPWFCYYMDVEIPHLNKALATANEPKKEAPKPANEDELDVDALFGTAEPVQKPKDKRAGGLYMTLSNPASGKAKFSTLSWKTVRENELLENPAQFTSRIDPKTYSTAPNPDYDELPMHLMFGVSSSGKWEFLKGNNGWGGILTSDKLSAYMDSAATDWMHCVHAIPKLVSLYNNGKLLNTCTFDKDWESTLREKLMALQDPQTGMWMVNGKPSLYATYQVVMNCFLPEGIPHPGYKATETPWLGLKDFKLQNVDAMIASIIAQQRHFGGKSVPAAWNSYAFMDDVNDIEDADLPCEMAPTSYAARLLLVASKLTANEKSKAAAEASIKDAWHFVMKNMFMRSAAQWKHSYSDKVPTIPDAMYDFIEGTQWLDLRHGKGLRLQPPATTLDEEGAFTLKWNKPEKDFVSLRIYVAPADKLTADLTEANLVAIVQPKSSTLLDQDPYNAIKAIVAEGEARWKITPAAVGANYIASKIAALPKSLKTYSNPASVKFKIPKKPVKQAVHIAAVTAYGEMSNFITLVETIPAAEGETEGN
ncbi:MAG: hypothetical protein J5746_08355 [Victivallales bacterium]|nr:hypothetical protein [Victivallales bacterium]